MLPDLLVVLSNFLRLVAADRPEDAPFAAEMVERIKKGTKETLSTLEALWGVLLIVAQTAAAVVLAVYACTFNEFGYLVVATVAVACVLAANVLLTLFRLIRKTA